MSYVGVGILYIFFIYFLSEFWNKLTLARFMKYIVLKFNK